MDERYQPDHRNTVLSLSHQGLQPGTVLSKRCQRAVRDGDTVLQVHLLQKMTVLPEKRTLISCLVDKASAGDSR